MDIELYETVIQSLAAELNAYISEHFRGDERLGFAFHPRSTWDDAWKLIQHFEASVPWWKGQQFHIYWSVLLRQKVAGVFRLSSLDKPTVCKAAVLAILDPLEFHEKLQAIMEEHGQESGFSAFALAMANATIKNDESPMHRRATDKIVRLQIEDMQWRIDNDVPL